MKRKEVDFDVVRRIAMELPDTEESTLHGVPSVKLRGKLLACPAIHKSAESNSLVVKIALQERAQLISAKPAIYYVAEHYLRTPAVLVRLSKIDEESLQTLLKKAWLFAIESISGSKRKSSKKKVSSRSRTK